MRKFKRSIKRGKILELRAARVDELVKEKLEKNEHYIAAKQEFHNKLKCGRAQETLEDIMAEVRARWDYEPAPTDAPKSQGTVLSRIRRQLKT